MAPEKQEMESLAGMMTGQKVALVLLVKVMHTNGVLDGNIYNRALKNTFNDPAAKFERQEYEYMQRLAQTLDAELAELPAFKSGTFE